MYSEVDWSVQSVKLLCMYLSADIIIELVLFIEDKLTYSSIEFVKSRIISMSN